MKVPGKSLFAAVALSVAALTSGCDKRTDAEVRVAQGVSKGTIANEGRQEIHNIVSDYHTVRAYVGGDHPPMLILMDTMLDPKDISSGMVVINSKNPEPEKLKILQGEVAHVASYFGRMNWDFENPGADPAFSKAELEDVGAEIAKKGAGLDYRMDAAMDKLKVSGAIRTQQLSSAAPSVER